MRSKRKLNDNIELKHSYNKKEKNYKKYKKNINKNNLSLEQKKKIDIKKIILIIFLLVIVITLIYFGYKYYKRMEISKKINDQIFIEYGEKLTLDYILKDNFKSVQTKPKLSSIKSPGKYDIILTINGEKFKVKINVKDTTPPDLKVKDVQRYLDEELPKVEDFVDSVKDLSKVKLSMSEIERSAGEHEVTITATDKYNNKTSKTSKLTLLEYKGSVKFTGLTSLNIETGDKVDLKRNVKAVDERFGELEVIVDDSKVNYNVPGIYKIYYSVKDQIGNTAVKERTITVKSKTVMINNFPTYSQFPNYPNGCETIALYLMLKYYGVSVSPETLVNNLKKGDGVHWENGIRYGGDPEIEFVGDPRNKNGYGVYQRPIINLASKYKSGMVDYTGHSLSQVLEIVRSGKPVQVWVSINLRNTSVCADWTHKSTGKKINWICNLHSLVVIGFNDNYVYTSDPYTGSIKKYSKSQFQKIYNLFGKRAIYFN